MSRLLQTAFQFDIERLWPGMNRNGPELERVFHIHRASHGSGWPRGFYQLNSSPHSWIFTSVSLGSNPRSYSFTSSMVRTAMIIVAQKLVQSLWRSPFIHFQARRRAASLRFFPTVFLCEQKPNLIWISFPGARASCYTVNIVLASLD